MSNPLRTYYASHIAQIEKAMMAELEYWPWEDIPQLREMAANYLLRTGKRLRPLLMLLFVDVLDGQLEKAYAPAAALGVYHTATLIYDDIQDNSEFRRGLPCAHITTSTSMAMNLAGTIRSFMYHILHRASALSGEERLEIRHLIDEAATKVLLGQSIDIGWHEQWYPNYQDYPYEQMIRWKSAALFGCAAAIGALLAEKNHEEVQRAEIIGNEFGVFFQKIDDYQDIFGNPTVSGRTLYNDLQEGKLSQPVLCLLHQLSVHGKHEQREQILRKLSERSAGEKNWQWLVHLMLDYDVVTLLQKDFCQIEKKLLQLLLPYKDRGEAGKRLVRFITSLAATTQSMNGEGEWNV